MNLTYRYATLSAVLSVALLVGIYRLVLVKSSVDDTVIHSSHLARDSNVAYDNLSFVAHDSVLKDNPSFAAPEPIHDVADDSIGSQHIFEAHSPAAESHTTEQDDEHEAEHPADAHHSNDSEHHEPETAAEAPSPEPVETPSAEPEDVVHPHPHAVESDDTVHPPVEAHPAVPDDASQHPHSAETGSATADAHSDNHAEPHSHAETEPPAAPEAHSEEQADAHSKSDDADSPREEHSEKVKSRQEHEDHLLAARIFADKYLRRSPPASSSKKLSRNVHDTPARQRDATTRRHSSDDSYRAPKRSTRVPNSVGSAVKRTDNVRRSWSDAYLHAQARNRAPSKKLSTGSPRTGDSQRKLEKEDIVYHHLDDSNDETYSRSRGAFGSPSKKYPASSYRDFDSEVPRKVTNADIRHDRDDLYARAVSSRRSSPYSADKEKARKLKDADSIRRNSEKPYARTSQGYGQQQPSKRLTAEERALLQARLRLGQDSNEQFNPSNRRREPDRYEQAYLGAIRRSMRDLEEL